MPSKWTYGRIAAAVIALLLTGVGIPGFLEWWNTDLQAWSHAEPVRLKVDLSRPGAWSGSFRQICPNPHEMKLLIVSTPPPASLESSCEVMKGLALHYEMRDEEGGIVTGGEVSPDQMDWWTWPGETGCPTIDVRPFRRGTYAFTLTVKNPAPAMAGHSQVVVARYGICGLEGLPGTIGMVIAIVCFSVASLIGICLYRSLRRHGGEH